MIVIITITAEQIEFNGNRLTRPVMRRARCGNTVRGGGPSLFLVTNERPPIGRQVNKLHYTVYTMYVNSYAGYRP